MSQERKIREAVQKMSGTWLKDYASFIDCEVVSVDIDNRLCNCKAIGGDSDFDVPSVQLMTEPNDGQLIIPKIGSAVRVGITKRNEPFVVMFSDIDTVYMVAETLYQFNDGSFGGLTKTPELKTQLEKMNEQLKAVIGSLQNWTVVANDGGAALKSYFTSQITGKPEADFGDIENEMITHGI
jgi:hypothetical protein